MNFYKKEFFSSEISIHFLYCFDALIHILMRNYKQTTYEYRFGLWNF